MSENMKIFDEVEEMITSAEKKQFSEKVIEHFHNPRNYGKLDNYDCYTYMTGICGDTVGFFLKLSEGKIERIGYETDGCGPTVACASALSCMAEGLSFAEAMSMQGKDLVDYLDGLPIENTHCADLAVNTLKGALEKCNTDS